MGPLKQESHGLLADARWNEKLAAIILVAGILAIGIAPGWLNELLRPETAIIMEKINSVK
jgi:NADH-quinone oxidoreductase subunit M